MGPTNLASYTHDHPEVRNINDAYEGKRTIGQKAADAIASLVGSWPFILVQSMLLLVWIAYNAVVGKGKAFDPFPFILLNLALSFQAAYTGPIVMMSQNRQAAKDRLVAQSDFECNQTAEVEIRLIMEHLVRQDEMLREMSAKLERMTA